MYYVSLASSPLAIRGFVFEELGQKNNLKPSKDLNLKIEYSKTIPRPTLSFLNMEISIGSVVKILSYRQENIFTFYIRILFH